MSSAQPAAVAVCKLGCSPTLIMYAYQHNTEEANMSWSVREEREAKRRLVLVKWAEHVAHAKAAGQKSNMRKFVMDSKGKLHETNITSLKSWLDRYAARSSDTSKTDAVTSKTVTSNVVSMSLGLKPTISAAPFEDNFNSFFTERRQSENNFRLNFFKEQRRLLQALLADIDKQIAELEDQPR